MSNARNLANLLGTGSTIATAKIADDAITAAKIDDDGTGFTVGDLTVGNITSTGVTTGFVAPDSLVLDGSSVATVTVNSAVSASATIVVDGVSGTIAVGMVVNVSDTTVRSISDAASQSAISVDDTLTITAVASQTSFTVSEAVTIADNVVLILRADESENFVLDASAASTDVGEKIQFEDGTNDVSVVLKDGIPSGIAVNSPSLPAGSVVQVHTELSTGTLGGTIAGQSAALTAASGTTWHTCGAFTPKFSNSLILFQTSTISMHETGNVASGHFALVTDGATLFAKTATMVSYTSWNNNNNAGFIAFNHSFNSWGTEPKSLVIKFGAAHNASTAGTQYVNKNSSDGYTHATSKEIGITIIEIAQ